ncbi:MAG: hypothetical protein U0441_19160 [Polyangiaceae bacterium]
MWEPFERAAKNLGLAFRVAPGLTGSGEVTGELEGQRVRTVWSDRATVVRAELDPPLDLGLHVTSKAFVTLPSLSERVLLGDSNWDDEVVATADEAARGATLFEGDARRAVLGVNASSIGFLVTDERVDSYALQYDTGALESALQRVARVAALIHQGRASIPPPSVLAAHAEALATLARERGLTHERTPLRLSGALGPARVTVQFTREARGAFDLRVRAEPLEGSLGAGVRIRRETLVDRVRKIAGYQDLRTGDAAFDPMFLVQAEDEARAVAALDADVRALLLELARRFDEVEIDEAGITARGPARQCPAAEIVSLIEASTTVVDRIARASAAEVRGPYR